jgi:hypothetical protein
LVPLYPVGKACKHHPFVSRSNRSFRSLFFLYSSVFFCILSYIYLSIHLSYMYWRNVVLGDVMLAPFAVRPLVGLPSAVTTTNTICVNCSNSFEFSVTPAAATVSIYLNGTLAYSQTFSANGTAAIVRVNDSFWQPFPLDVDLQLLLVAQDLYGAQRSKGWVSRTIRLLAPAPTTAAPTPRATTAAPATVSPDQNAMSSSSSNAGAIAGGIIAALVVIAVVVVLVVLWLRYRKQHSSTNKPEANLPASDTNITA